MKDNLLVGQGLYYLITGIWPLFSISTFEKVPGAKTDHWLVKTIGLLLLVVIGLALITGSLKRSVTSELAIIGIGSAGALMSIDVIYVFKRIISSIYLLDIIAELIFIG